MLFHDLALSQRLERAEGDACLQYAMARKRLQPSSNAAWMEHAGAHVVFDGIDSPVTQTFGLGIFEPITAAALETIERFFLERGAPVQHEISPFVGVAGLDLIASRYKPVEISSVMCREVEEPGPVRDPRITVRIASVEESELWSRVATEGWAHELPQLREFMEQTSTIFANRSNSTLFLAAYDGVPGAAGALCIHEGVALLAGASTIPSLRRRGLQGALLQARLGYAARAGCDIAMMGAEAGSNSQRNAERKGFRVAYTRTKWQLR